jgi:hypothetical protein
MSAAGTAETGRPRPGVRLATAQWLADFHPAGFMHGAVVMGAVLALVDDEGSSTLSVMSAAAGVLVIYWLTHAYTDALGQGLSGERRHLLHRLLRFGRRDSPLLLGGVPALLVFAVALGFGTAFAGAVEIALWVTLVLLAGCGYLAAHIAGVTGWRLLTETVFAGLVGAFMISINTWLH